MFYAGGTLGCLKLERVGDFLTQKAAESHQDLASFIVRFDVSTDNFNVKGMYMDNIYVWSWSEQLCRLKRDL